MDGKLRLLDLNEQYREINLRINDILRKHNLNLLEYKKLPQEDFIEWQRLKERANEINSEMTNLINQD